MRFYVTFLLFLWGVALTGCAWKGGPATGKAALTTPVTVTPIFADRENASYLQMGEFTDQHKAGQLLQRISKIGVSAFIVQEAGLYQVKSGPYLDADQALRRKQELDQMLNIEARVVFE